MSSVATENEAAIEIARELPRHAQLRLALQARVKTMAPGERLPSIAALQAEFDLAQGTVVRGLRDLRHAGLIEARHGSGYFATGHRKLLNIGVYFNLDLHHPDAGTFPRLLLKGLHEAAGKFEDIRLRHYFTLGSDCLWHDRVCALNFDVQQRLVDGIVLFGHFDGNFDSLRIPVVGWQFLPKVKSLVAMDDKALVRMGLRALKARGCQSVAFLTSAPQIMPEADSPYYEFAQYHREVHEYFLHETARLGLKTRPEWIAYPAFGSGSVESRSAENFRVLWKSCPAKPDALLSLDDYRTRGALAAAAQLGITPGKNLYIASHTNRGSDVLTGHTIIQLEVDPTLIAQALLSAVRKQVMNLTHSTNRVLVPPRVITPK